MRLNLPSNLLRMADLISSEHRHYLWKDEVGDDFILTKYAEVYRYSETHLRVLAWRTPDPVNWGDFGTNSYMDDGLWVIDTPNEKLAELLAILPTVKRFARRSGWLQDKERRLGHKILPCKPRRLYPKTGNPSPFK